MSKEHPDDVSPDGRILRIVDPHQHFWDLKRNYHPWLCDKDLIPFRYGDYSSLRRNYLPQDYRTDWGEFEVTKTVHVEAESDPAAPIKETVWLEEIAQQNGLPSACVAQAWLDRDDVDDVLARQSEHGLVRGIRHKPKAAASPAEAKRGQPGSMDDPKWRRGYELLGRYDLSYDLQTPWWHLDAAAELADDFPQTRIIINHTALPADRSAEGLAGWRAALDQAALRPNICLKISGLGLRGQAWSAEANAPVIRDAISIFGIDRCMFASNFPVDSLVGSFADIMNGFATAVADRPVEVRRKLFRENAERIYRL